MTKLNTYTANGTKATSLDFPNNLVEKENDALLAQAIRVYTSRSHTKDSKVKTRSEVKFTTKKVWRQKGTGRARHGARSAPIFVGGGKAHGPKGVSRQLSLPKKMKRKALAVSFGRMIKAKKMVFVKGISTIKKTKDASDLIGKIIKKESNETKPKKIIVALGSENLEKKSVFKNIKGVETENFSTLNVYKVFFSDFLIIDSEAFSKKTSEKPAKKEKESKKK